MTNHRVALPTRNGSTEALSPAIQHVLDSIHDIKFGTVEIVIHDSRIVQVQRSEKSRFDIPRTNQ